VCLENQTGFLLRPGDLAGLRKRLTALAVDADLRTRLGTAGRDFVKERFPVERMVDDLYALYLKTLSGTEVRVTDERGLESA
jgi:glycosyltransferase involved in cell wall biosynthesis